MDFKNPKVKYDANLSEWHKDNAQIKHVENDGNFSDSPNIYKSGAEISIPYGTSRPKISRKNMKAS